MHRRTAEDHQPQEGTSPRVAGVELGGSHAVVLIGRGPQALDLRVELATTSPADTLGAIAEVLAPWRGELAGVGVASFGPLRRDSVGGPFVGLGRTPKPGWTGAPISGPLAESAAAPVFLDTDVNLAALGEWRWGAGRGVEDLVYLTVGTGIGGGALVRGEVVHGALHPEMGHLRLARLPEDRFPGTCPVHGDCWEGLASGPAMEARWGRSPALLPDAHPAWELEARLLARGLAALGLVLAPRRIILGGGVLKRPGLLELTRLALADEVGGYGPLSTAGLIGDLVHAPALAPDSGAMGALAWALVEAGGQAASS